MVDEPLEILAAVALLALFVLMIGWLMDLALKRKRPSLVGNPKTFFRGLAGAYVLIPRSFDVRAIDRQTGRERIETVEAQSPDQARSKARAWADDVIEVKESGV